MATTTFTQFKNATIITYDASTKLLNRLRNAQMLTNPIAAAEWHSCAGDVEAVMVPGEVGEEEWEGY